MTTLDDLCEDWPDRSALCAADAGAGYGPLAPLANRYAEDGLVVITDLLDDDVVDAYCAEYVQHSPDHTTSGFQYATPYMDHPFVLDLCMRPEIIAVAETLVGEPMGLHLNLSNWRSTTRNWHQDGYLNPDSNLDWYVAVWIALDDVHPDAGPFEYVPGSHRQFGVIRNDRMRAALEPHEQGPDWPTHTERILTPIFEDAIAERELPVEQFLARKGDVLFWHPRLLHRGSTPNDPSIPRKSLISHYSGIHHRPDMPPAVNARPGWYFPVNDPGGGMK